MPTDSMSYTTVIPTDILASHLGEDDWAIVDCRFDLADPGSGEAAYRQSHIPGAVYAHLDRDLSAPVTPRSGRHPLPDMAAFAERVAAWGIGAGVQVVAYDHDAGMYASRFWWMLRSLGHEAAAVLDGGMAKWVREARPVRAGEEQRARRAFAGELNGQRYADIDEVARLTGDARYRLIDSRAPERYRGEVEPLDPIAGHIPGAVNHLFRENLTSSGTFLPREEVRRRLAGALGNVPPERTVVYCGSGVFACQNLLALEYAGLPGARLYAGSWSEWCRDPKRPIATGAGEERK